MCIFHFYLKILKKVEIHFHVCELPSIPRWCTLWFRKPLYLYWSAEISVKAGRGGVVLLIFLLSALPENKHCLDSSWLRKSPHPLYLGVTGAAFGCACLWIHFHIAIFWYFIMSDCAALESWSCRSPWMNDGLLIDSVCIIPSLQSSGKPQQIA